MNKNSINKWLYTVCSKSKLFFITVFCLILSVNANSNDSDIKPLPPISKYPFPQGHLAPQIFDQFYPKIMEEVAKEFSLQNDGRTRRNTREYGYSFFKMINGDFSYNPPPEFLQELGASICKSLGHEPVRFTNIILSCYEEGYHLEPHLDINSENTFNFGFYFEENVYGIVIEPDPTGHLYFVKWEGGLIPPLDLKPIYDLMEEKGSIFCLQGHLRKAPYFHGVSNVSKHRITITFRTVKKDAAN